MISPVWMGDFGNIYLPDDFPTTILRCDGWWDRRYKIVAEGKRYIAEMDAKIRDGEANSGFRAPSFNEWRAGAV